VWDSGGYRSPHAPAFTLTLTLATAGAVSALNAKAPAPAISGATQTTARWLGGIGIALGVVGVATALAVALHTGRESQPS
jgi:hypothetical protein